MQFEKSLSIMTAFCKVARRDCRIPAPVSGVISQEMRAMKHRPSPCPVIVFLIMAVSCAGCVNDETSPRTPKIASWLAKKEDIVAYSDFCDGFLLENFMGTQCGSTYQDGLRAAEADTLILYGVDTDDTGVLDMKKMRPSLTLSLLHDTTWFTCDVGPRDHGDAWWFPEYDVDLGPARGAWYQQDGAYFREFAHGTVVSAPPGPVTVTFPAPFRDVSTGERACAFTVADGDGRIFLADP